MKTNEKLGIISSYIFILILICGFVYMTLTQPLITSIIAIINIAAAGLISFLILRRLFRTLFKK